MLLYKIFVIDIVADEDLSVLLKLGVCHGVVGKKIRIQLILNLEYQRFIVTRALRLIGDKGIYLTGLELFGLGEQDIGIFQLEDIKLR